MNGLVCEWSSMSGPFSLRPRPHFKWLIRISFLVYFPFSNNHSLERMAVETEFTLQ